MTAKSLSRDPRPVINTYTLTISAAMAAIICVITSFRIPVGQSKLHFANSMCLLSGLLLGPIWGSVAAGLGSALYDVLLDGRGLLDALITFVSKFAMAWVTSVLFRALVTRFLVLRRKEKSWQNELPILAVSCVLGALTYVALYMLKTWIFKMYVEPVPADTLPTIMIGKLIPSLINAGFAAVTAPIFFRALQPALQQLLKRMYQR